jgi:hypothetical protein
MKNSDQGTLTRTEQLYKNNPKFQYTSPAIKKYYACCVNYQWGKKYLDSLVGEA